MLLRKTPLLSTSVGVRTIRTSAIVKLGGYGDDHGSFGDCGKKKNNKDNANNITPICVLPPGHGHSHEASLERPKQKTKDGALIVNNTAFSLEWILDSPPPLHCFLEPPIIVEWPAGEEGHH